MKLNKIQEQLTQLQEQVTKLQSTKKQSTKENLFVQILLDRTGSMCDRWKEATHAVNTYVTKLDHNTPTSVRLTVFDSEGIDIIRDTKLSDFNSIEENEIHPRSMTNLFDAIGNTVEQITKKVKPDERVAFVILTDGYENASREFTKKTVKKLLTDKQENEGWLVVFLGADIDAMSSGAQIGTVSMNTMSASKAKMGETMSLAAHKTALYSSAPTRQSGRGMAAFTQEDREYVL